MLVPENETAWEIFQHISTQARVGGMGGLVGFDYSALPVLFEAYGVPLCEWQNYLEKIKVLGEIAVRLINEQSDSK